MATAVSAASSHATGPPTGVASLATSPPSLPEAAIITGDQSGAAGSRSPPSISSPREQTPRTATRRNEHAEEHATKPSAAEATSGELLKELVDVAGEEVRRLLRYTVKRDISDMGGGTEVVREHAQHAIEDVLRNFFEKLDNYVGFAVRIMDATSCSIRNGWQAKHQDPDGRRTAILGEQRRVVDPEADPEVLVLQRQLRQALDHARNLEQQVQRALQKNDNAEEKFRKMRKQYYAELFLWKQRYTDMKLVVSQERPDMNLNDDDIAFFDISQFFDEDMVRMMKQKEEAIIQRYDTEMKALNRTIDQLKQQKEFADKRIGALQVTITDLKAALSTQSSRRNAAKVASAGAGLAAKSAAVKLKERGDGTRLSAVQKDIGDEGEEWTGTASETPKAIRSKSLMARGRDADRFKDPDEEPSQRESMLQSRLDTGVARLDQLHNLQMMYADKLKELGHSSESDAAINRAANLAREMLNEQTARVDTLRNYFEPASSSGLSPAEANNVDLDKEREKCCRLENTVAELELEKKSQSEKLQAEREQSQSLRKVIKESKENCEMLEQSVAVGEDRIAALSSAAKESEEKYERLDLEISMLKDQRDALVDALDQANEHIEGLEQHLTQQDQVVQDKGQQIVEAQRLAHLLRAAHAGKRETLTQELHEAPPEPPEVEASDEAPFPAEEMPRRTRQRRPKGEAVDDAFFKEEQWQQIGLLNDAVSLERQRWQALLPRCHSASAIPGCGWRQTSVHGCGQEPKSARTLESILTEAEREAEYQRYAALFETMAGARLAGGPLPVELPEEMERAHVRLHRVACGIRTWSQQSADRRALTSYLADRNKFQVSELSRLYCAAEVRGNLAWELQRQCLLKCKEALAIMPEAHGLQIDDALVARTPHEALQHLEDLEDGCSHWAVLKLRRVQARAHRAARQRMLEISQHAALEASWLVCLQNQMDQQAFEEHVRSAANALEVPAERISEEANATESSNDAPSTAWHQYLQGGTEASNALESETAEQAIELKKEIVVLQQRLGKLRQREAAVFRSTVLSAGILQVPEAASCAVGRLEKVAAGEDEEMTRVGSDTSSDTTSDEENLEEDTGIRIDLTKRRGGVMVEAYLDSASVTAEIEKAEEENEAETETLQEGSALRPLCVDKPLDAAVVPLSAPLKDDLQIPEFHSLSAHKAMWRSLAQHKVVDREGVDEIARPEELTEYEREELETQEIKAADLAESVRELKQQALSAPKASHDDRPRMSFFVWSAPQKEDDAEDERSDGPRRLSDISLFSVPTITSEQEDAQKGEDGEEDPVYRKPYLVDAAMSPIVGEPGRDATTSITPLQTNPSDVQTMDEPFADALVRLLRSSDGNVETCNPDDIAFCVYEFFLGRHGQLQDSFRALLEDPPDGMPKVATSRQSPEVDQAVQTEDLEEPARERVSEATVLFDDGAEAMASEREREEETDADLPDTGEEGAPGREGEANSCASHEGSELQHNIPSMIDAGVQIAPHCKAEGIQTDPPEVVRFEGSRRSYFRHVVARAQDSRSLNPSLSLSEQESSPSLRSRAQGATTDRETTFFGALKKVLEANKSSGESRMDFGSILLNTIKQAREANTAEPQEQPTEADKEDDEVINTLVKEVVDVAQQCEIPWDSLPERLFKWLKLNLMQRQQAAMYCTSWTISPLEEFSNMNLSQREKAISDFESFLLNVMMLKPPLRATEHRRALRQRYRKALEQEDDLQGSKEAEEFWYRFQDQWIQIGEEIEQRVPFRVRETEPLVKDLFEEVRKKVAEVLNRATPLELTAAVQTSAAALMSAAPGQAPPMVIQAAVPRPGSRATGQLKQGHLSLGPPSSAQRYLLTDGNKAVIASGSTGVALSVGGRQLSSREAPNTEEQPTSVSRQSVAYDPADACLAPHRRMALRISNLLGFETSLPQFGEVQQDVLCLQFATGALHIRKPQGAAALTSSEQRQHGASSLVPWLQAHADEKQGLLEQGTRSRSQPLEGKPLAFFPEVSETRSMSEASTWRERERDADLEVERCHRNPAAAGRPPANHAKARTPRPLSRRTPATSLSAAAYAEQRRRELQRANLLLQRLDGLRQFHGNHIPQRVIEQVQALDDLDESIQGHFLRVVGETEEQKARATVYLDDLLEHIERGDHCESASVELSKQIGRDLDHELVQDLRGHIDNVIMGAQQRQGATRKLLGWAFKRLKAWADSGAEIGCDASEVYGVRLRSRSAAGEASGALLAEEPPRACSSAPPQDPSWSAAGGFLPHLAAKEGEFIGAVAWSYGGPSTKPATPHPSKTSGNVGRVHPQVRPSTSQDVRRPESTRPGTSMSTELRRPETRPGTSMEHARLSLAGPRSLMLQGSKAASRSETPRVYSAVTDSTLEALGTMEVLGIVQSCNDTSLESVSQGEAGTSHSAGREVPPRGWMPLAADDANSRTQPVESMKQGVAQRGPSADVTFSGVSQASRTSPMASIDKPDAATHPSRPGGTSAMTSVGAPSASVFARELPKGQPGAARGSRGAMPPDSMKLVSRLPVAKRG